MRTELTTEQVTAYRENGFLVIEDFLTPGELEHWRAVTEEAVRERLAQGKEVVGKWTMTNQDDPNSFYARVFVQCIKLADTHAGMRELMLDPALGRVAAELAGVPGIRIWHDQALFKQPFGNPTAWHLDNPYWSFSSRDSLSIWVALDDATPANGCLYYLPGTHKTARFENVGIGQNMDALFAHYPEWKEITPVACPCPAGSAVFHNGLTAHGAGANMTNRPRRAMTCAYMPDGATFNGEKNVLPDEYFATLRIGDPLTDEVVNPLVWRA
jgi:phytanoyl-CoA hydroxylase